MPKTRALIFANGEQIRLESVREMLRPEDWLVAADGGLRFLRQLGREPDLVIGDLDSLTPDQVQDLKSSPVEVAQFPVDKDETDLELALQAAARAGFQEILVFAALGGRMDMTLTNIFLLGIAELAGRDVRLEDGGEEIFFIWPGEAGREITGQAGDRVSLLAWNGPANGVRTEGLYYPLRSETLWPERSRGVSNRMVENRARVSLDAGTLICIHTRQK